MTPGKFKNIDEYHASFPKETRVKLDNLRQTIRSAAPRATEQISYNMPAFKMNKALVFYAGYARHIGFYPMPSAIKYFANELNGYSTSKGAIQFPLDKPIPVSLVKKIVKFRLAEDQKKAASASNKTGDKKISIDPLVKAYHAKQNAEDRKICEILYQVICKTLPEAENKIWHAHPVWFLEGNPVVGYSKLKDSIRLLFWSGQSFDETGLQNEGSFKAAEARFTKAIQIRIPELKRWLKKARDIQWDYKNIVKRKGRLERLK